MQPIHRTSFPLVQPGSPDGTARYLATLIDQQARTPALAADSTGCKLGLVAPWDTNALVWVEEDAGGGPIAVHDRGIIAVTHGPGPQGAGRSYVISYPGASDDKRHLIPVMVALTGMSWHVLARKSRRTATGNTNTAVLVCAVRPGLEQRLWLAEPAAGSTLPSPVPGTRDQVKAWVNQGGAGDNAR